MTRRRNEPPAEIPPTDAPPAEGAPAELATAPVDPKALQAVLRSQGVPTSAWAGTIAKMSDRVKGELTATLEAEKATPATAKRWREWRQDRAEKIRTAPSRKAGG